MFGLFRLSGFFLTDEQIKKLGNYSVDLFAEASNLIKTRSDFTFEELLNTAFLGAYNGRKLHTQR